MDLMSACSVFIQRGRIQADLD